MSKYNEMKADRSTDFSIGVIISTYNHPEWLQKTLWGYACQTENRFELIIADDGSTKETALLIDQFRQESFPNIKHIWHADNGFQKCKILNKALAEARADYLIFSDQDCIPRHDFIATHRRYAQEGYFLSGGYFRLPMDISLDIRQEDIVSQQAFSLQWLRSKGLKKSIKDAKLTQSASFASFMNTITPARASWNGCNSSGWRKDMLAINGFNEQMQYGGEDREFGERLVNMGIRSKQIRYSSVCLHLDHKRPYKNQEAIDKNRAIRKETKSLKRIQTPWGIEYLSPERE